MPRTKRSSASEGRNLLPRSPSDRVIFLCLVAGLALASVLRIDPTYGLLLGAVPALAQLIRGHMRAWRSRGVERAFVMESAAISFYVSVAALLILAVLEQLNVGSRVHMAVLVVGALYVDTMVRKFRVPLYA